MSPDWVDLCAVGDLSEDRGEYVVCKGRALAVFLVGDGSVRVMDDACPHAGASLAGGHVHNGCVICPWHGWPFHVDSGRCADNPDHGVHTYPTRVFEGRVWIKVK